jgi:maltose O-acetyltransferase
MLTGELYLASDPEWGPTPLRAQALLARFNATATDADEERRLLLRQLLGRTGEGTFVNYDCLLLDCNRIISDEVQLALGVHLYTMV